MTLENLKSNKNLLFSITHTLDIGIDDFLKFAKNFNYPKSDLISALFFSKNYYFNHSKGTISYRFPAQRKVLTFRNATPDFNANEIFKAFKVVESKASGKNEGLLEVQFDDEKEAVKAFQFYEHLLEEKSKNNEQQKFPSCFMKCENLKQKILGIKPEDEEIEISMIPAFNPLDAQISGFKTLDFYEYLSRFGPKTEESKLQERKDDLILKLINLLRLKKCFRAANL